MDRTKKAGAIILSHSDNSKILLIHGGKSNDYQFPKGHVESGENDLQTMRREVKEETGLDVEVLQVLPAYEYENTIDGAITVAMWCVRSKNDAALKKEFESDELIWVPCDKTRERLSYENLKEYYDVVLPEILSLMDLNPKLSRL
jgi:8-oxo-dGTP pyrophosphatase MutT (NUDIX family)